MKTRDIIIREKMKGKQTLYNRKVKYGGGGDGSHGVKYP